MLIRSPLVYLDEAVFRDCCRRIAKVRRLPTRPEHPVYGSEKPEQSNASPPWPWFHQELHRQSLFSQVVHRQADSSIPAVAPSEISLPLEMGRLTSSPATAWIMPPGPLR
jgi:hypothetical protein